MVESDSSKASAPKGSCQNNECIHCIATAAKLYDQAPVPLENQESMVRDNQKPIRII